MFKSSYLQLQVLFPPLGTQSIRDLQNGKHCFMLTQMQSHFLHPCNFNKLPVPPALVASPAPFSIRPRCSTTSPSAVGDTISAPLISKQHIPKSPSPTQSLVSATPLIGVVKNLGFRPTPELGLLSHLFVLSMAFGAFFSVALVSIPTMIAFGRLGASMKKLSKVVSEEVPATLSSLKLSSMELNDLTQQLGSLRHKISGVPKGKKDGNTTSSRSFNKKNPAS